MTDFNRRISDLENAASGDEPRRFVFPFGIFDSLEDATQHPGWGHFVEERRRFRFNLTNLLSVSEET